MYYLLYLFVWSIAILPLPILYLFSNLFYLVLYYLIAYRKQVVRDNLRYSFPEKSEEELRKIEKEFYRHLSDVIFEGLKLLKMSEQNIEKRMKFFDYEPIVEHLNNGLSVMAMTSHYGNWEWQSSFSLLLPKDKPAYQVYKKQKGDAIIKLIDIIRKRFGAKNVDMKNLLREMYKMRDQGLIGVFGLLSDQSPVRTSVHYYTEFLHQHTATISGTEQIAKKFDYPVYYARMKKLKRGYYTCHFIPIAVDSKNTDTHEITENYFKLLEEDIQAAPAYWLWSHKRWKLTRGL